MAWQVHFRKVFCFMFIVVVALSLAGCKKSSSAGGGGSSSVVSKTYWTQARIEQGFDLKFALQDGSAGFANEDIEQLEVMSQKWNDLLGTGDHLNYDTVPNKDYVNLASYQDDEFGVYTSSQWFASLGSTALAITQYFGYYRPRSNGDIWLEMQHADLIFNFHDFRFSSEEDRHDGSYDLLSIALHELGHFWGLQHSANNTAVMYASIGQNTNRRNLQPDDKAAFKAIYEYAEAAGMQADLHPKRMNVQSVYPTDDEEDALTLEDDSYELPVAEEDEVLYRFVVELRADGTHYYHLPERVPAWCFPKK